MQASVSNPETNMICKNDYIEKYKMCSQLQEPCFFPLWIRKYRHTSFVAYSHWNKHYIILFIVATINSSCYASNNRKIRGNQNSISIKSRHKLLGVKLTDIVSEVVKRNRDRRESRSGVITWNQTPNLKCHCLFMW